MAQDSSIACAHPAIEILLTSEHNEPLLEALANGDMAQGYERALELARTEPKRRFLKRRLSEVSV